MHIFSKIELMCSFQQIPVAEMDIQKMAIITPFGLYKFLKIPFRLRNYGLTFQRLMDAVCHDFQFAIVYIDDIFIASKDAKRKKEHLRLLFQRLQQYGLVVNAAKWQFGCSSLDFLGHRITDTNIVPLPGKVEVVVNM